MKDIYEFIVQKSKDGIWVTDKNDVIYYANKSMEIIAGTTGSEILHKNVLTDFPDETTKDFNHFYLKVKKTLKPVSYEVKVVIPEGRNTWQFGWLVPKIADKKFDGIICTVEDITERKQAEEELIKTQNFLRETEKSGKIGGWEVNLETMTHTWTEETYRIHEVDLDYKLNMSKSLRFYAPWARPLIEQAVNHTIETGEPFDLEVELNTAKGKKIWVHAVGKARMEGGVTKSLSGSFQEITERKQAEEKLKSRKQFNLLKDCRLASIISQAKRGLTVLPGSALIFICMLPAF